MRDARGSLGDIPSLGEAGALPASARSRRVKARGQGVRAERSAIPAKGEYSLSSSAMVRSYAQTQMTARETHPRICAWRITLRPAAILKAGSYWQVVVIAVAIALARSTAPYNGPSPPARAALARPREALNESARRSATLEPLLDWHHQRYFSIRRDPAVAVAALCQFPSFAPVCADYLGRQGSIPGTVSSDRR
jgi:hypothetical protein